MKNLTKLCIVVGLIAIALIAGLIGGLVGNLLHSTGTDALGEPVYKGSTYANPGISYVDGNGRLSTSTDVTYNSPTHSLNVAGLYVGNKSINLSYSDEGTSSGIVGLQIDKDSSNAVPSGILYSINNEPKWDLGMDYQNSDFVLAYTYDVTSPWGAGDMFRIDPVSRRIAYGPTLGSPSGLSAQFTIFRADGYPGLEMKSWDGTTDQFDWLRYSLNGDADNAWITWTLGDTKRDWRIGEVHNSKSFSYDIAFYNGNNSATNAASPGTQLFTFSGLGRLGIGVTEPNYALDVNGTVNGTTFAVSGNELASIVNGGINLDLGSRIPGINTPFSYIIGYSANTSWPISLGSIYDNSFVDQYVILNGQISGGTRASPTFTASSIGGGYMNHGMIQGQGPAMQLGLLDSGANHPPTPYITLFGGDVGINQSNPTANLEVTGSVKLGLPTSDPHVSGQLWEDTTSGNVVKVSGG